MVHLPNQPGRSEIPREQTWDLESLFSSSAAWEEGVAQVRATAAQLEQYKGRLADSAQTLLACLQARDAARIRLMHVAQYASHRRAVDGTDPEAQAMTSLARGLMAEVTAAFTFITSEIVALPEERLAGFLAEEPGLAVYRWYLEDVQSAAPHILSPETEAALATLEGALNAPNVIHLAVSTDMRFPAVTAAGESIAMSVARHERLLTSPDRAVRRQAHESLGAGLEAHKTAMATALGAHIQKTVTLARLRRFPSALEMYLGPTRLPTEVYHQSLAALLRGVAPIARRYVALRRQVLGLDQVWQYDLAAPLDPEYREGLSFAQGAEQIKTGLSVLGIEYGTILTRAFDERWVDWADNTGKQHGAYSSGIYGWHPVILMTWQDRIRDMFVLAHELGHTCHSFLSAKYQAFINVRGPRMGLFFIEAPSTCNEVLLGQHLLAQPMPTRRRRQIVEALLGTFWHNMVNHLLQAEVERRLYALAEAGKPVTLKAISAAQEDTFAEFYGGSVSSDGTDRLIWETVPHYYLGFYPLVYGVGLAGACAVAGAIQREGLPAVERWLAALRAGSTLYPLELFATAGIDMTRPEAIQAGIDYFGNLVAELEASYR